MKRVNCIFCFVLTIIFSADGYSVFEDNGKVGLKNEFGKVLIPAEYEALGWSDGKFSVLNNITGYRTKGKWGLISLNNHVLTKAAYEEIIPVDASFLIARKKSTLSLRIVAGVINAAGKEVIPFEYDNIQLSSLRAIVFTKMGNQYKYGLIDLENRILIPQQYKSIRSIGSLRYAVENFEGKMGLYTENGKQITDFTIDSISSFKKNYAIIYQGVYQGLIDRSGAIKIETKYREIKIEDDGAIFTRQPAEWLFLDGKNNLIKKVSVDSVTGMSKNLLKLHTSNSIHLTDYNLKPLSAATISTLDNFVKSKAVFSNRGKYGLIRSDGTVILEAKFSKLKPINAYYAANQVHGGKDHWVLLDSLGKPIHTKEYDRILDFNGKFFPVISRNFWGAIDTSGKEIISCTYDSILQHLNNHVVVKFHDQYGIINLSETWVVPPKQNKLRLVGEGRFIELAPRTTFLKSFDNSIIYFSENRLEIRGNHLLEHLQSGTVWEIDMNGVIVDRKILPELIEKIYPETEGLRGIKKNGQYGFIDSQGRLRIANRYDDIQPFSEQLAAMKIRGKWGFIGHDDKIAIQPVYDEVSDFKNGLAVVKLKGLQGVVDPIGKQILQPRYESVSVLPHGNIIIEQNKLFGLTDRQGRPLINPKFHKLEDLNNGYIIVERDGKYGSMTVQGISIIPLIYDYLSYDSFNNTFFAMIKSEWTNSKF